MSERGAMTRPAVGVKKEMKDLILLARMVFGRQLTKALDEGMLREGPKGNHCGCVLVFV